MSQLETLQRAVSTKVVHTEQVDTMCKSNKHLDSTPDQKQRSDKIRDALVQVQLPPDVLAKSKRKVKMINLIKTSLTKLLGLSKLNDAQGMYALHQEAQQLIAVESQLKKLSKSPTN